MDSENKIGYADGFGKQNENTNCLIHRKEYRIVEITMDNSFLEVDERVKVGDEVICLQCSESETRNREASL